MPASHTGRYHYPSDAITGLPDAAVSRLVLRRSQALGIVRRSIPDSEVCAIHMSLQPNFS